MPRLSNSNKAKKAWVNGKISAKTALKLAELPIVTMTITMACGAKQTIVGKIDEVKIGRTKVYRV